jgi:magnesium transporter
MPPGALLYTGKITGVDVIVDYVEYNNEVSNFESSSGAESFLLHASDVTKVQWYDIRGLHDDNIIRDIAERFKMHPIAIADAVDIHQRPTYIEYEFGHFISLKVLSFDKLNNKINRESLSLYFGDGFVITFQEKPNDTLIQVRQRILESKGRILSRKSDYLTYTIVDFIVDNYFYVLDAIEEEVGQLEESISNNPQNTDKSNIYELKKELLKIRKSVSPLREAINLFSRTESSLVEDRTVSFIRDVYDHTIHIIDNVDSMRDILSGLQDLYISEISLKMNKTMQFLTIVTAIFVPISFLTGLYGMNFEYMPELKFQYGYFILWGAMIFAVLAMLYYFRKNKWL